MQAAAWRPRFAQQQGRRRTSGAERCAGLWRRGRQEAHIPPAAGAAAARLGELLHSALAAAIAPASCFRHRLLLLPPLQLAAQGPATRASRGQAAHAGNRQHHGTTTGSCSGTAPRRRRACLCEAAPRAAPLPALCSHPPAAICRARRPSPGTAPGHSLRMRQRVGHAAKAHQPLLVPAPGHGTAAVGSLAGRSKGQAAQGRACAQRKHRHRRRLPVRVAAGCLRRLDVFQGGKNPGH